MRANVYSRLFDNLSNLIPTLSSAQAGAVFSAPPRIADDFAVYAHIAATDGDFRVIELADDNARHSTGVAGPWLKIRVDVANRQAEILEVEDAFGYQVVYVGAQMVNPRRPQINLYAVNWLQVMVNHDMFFQSADVSVVA